MRRVPTLMRRELISYFRAPLAYILAAAFSGIVLLFERSSARTLRSSSYPSVSGMPMSLTRTCGGSFWIFASASQADAALLTLAWHSSSTRQMNSRAASVKRI